MYVKRVIDMIIAVIFLNYSDSDNDDDNHDKNLLVLLL
jgi:hypothetical protein